MLKNYFEMDESLNLSNFLAKLNDKKNSHYILLETTPRSFVDVRTLALKINNLDEKLKSLKQPLATYNGNKRSDMLSFLIKSGDRVIDTDEGLFDFIKALKFIKDLELDFLNDKISTIVKDEVFALNEGDKISSARNLFLKKKINLLPVIENLQILGEVRPIDFLVSDLFNQNSSGKGNFYDKNYKDNVLNMPIENLINKRAITINKNLKIKNVIDIIIDKKLPSIIVVDDNDKLFSVVSYGDIFKLYLNETAVLPYRVEFSGTQDLYEDEFAQIKKFSDRSMEKIAKLSDYDNLKITFKSIGEKEESGHKIKLIVKGLVSCGNKVIQAEREIFKASSGDELQNDKRRMKWNVPQIVQEMLNVLTHKVIEEKNKQK